ncbi:DUF748 domain-containing protein [soil metagenome]
MKSLKNINRKWKILLFTILLLVIVRISLPYILLHFANKTLGELKGYYGHIDDIDIFLYKGAYQIKDFYLDKTDSLSKKNVPLISSNKIDMSIEWKSLIKGRLVGEMHFFNPHLKFTRDKTDPAALQKDSNNFRVLLDKFMPLKINKLEFINGKIQYVDLNSTPVVNLELIKTNLLAQNLLNVEDTAILPATIQASAELYQGKLNLNMKFDPLAVKPTFDMNTTLTNTNLPDLNNFFKAYANFDVNKGNFGLYTEMASKDGKFVGYIKPIIKNLDVVGKEDKHDSFVNKVWEVMVASAGIILRNPNKNQVATKIQVEGRIDGPAVNPWEAIGSLLNNAFIHALSPELENRISLSSIDEKEKKEKKNILQKIFGKSKSEKKKEKAK